MPRDSARRHGPRDLRLAEVIAAADAIRAAADPEANVEDLDIPSLLRR